MPAAASSTGSWSPRATSSSSTCWTPTRSRSRSTAAAPRAQVLIGGKTYNVDFKPAGSNTLKATGEFTAAKGMKVIVKTDKVGGQSFQARLAPLN